MPVTTIGDMSQHFHSVRNTGSIKSQLARLSQEMSSGLVSDVGKHLNGNTSGLTGLNHEISMLETFDVTNTETTRILDAMQQNLQGLDAKRDLTASSLLMISSDSNRNLVTSAAQTGKSAFLDAVNTLNASSGGRLLFSGTAVDQIPLADPQVILSDIVTAIGGATEKDDIISAVDNWFDAAGGGFESNGYLGNQEAHSRKLDAQLEIEIDVRADSTEIRELLKGLAYAAASSEISGALTDRTFADLTMESGIKLIEAADGITQLQARLGEKEEAVATAVAANASMLSAFEVARSDLVKADPFETAIKLQDIQTQLETHFAVTSRLSQLNLVDFLR